MDTTRQNTIRMRWAAAGAAVAVALTGGAIGAARATVSDGERAVFVAIAPCRLFDTRPGDDNVGSRSTPIGAGETFTQPARGTNGKCTIPSDATAVGLNVTAVNGTVASFLAIFPADVDRPLASSLNWAAGAPPTPNKVDVKLSGGGAVSFFNNAGSVDVLADVVGYYADHNHDDRYYTAPQIDERYYDKTQSDARYYTKPQSDERYYSKPESDDRFASSVQTVTLGGFSAQPAGGTMTFVNSCATGADAGTNALEVPLPMPVGSKLLSVDLAVYDTSFSVTPYEARLQYRKRAGVSYGGGGTLASVTSAGDNSVIVDYHMVPEPSYTAAEGEFLTLQLFGARSLANGICAVTYRYDTTS